MATKPKAQTEDERIDLVARAVILAFDILGANTLQRIRVIRKLTDKAFADLEDQVQRELAGEHIPPPPVVSETAFRSGLRRAIFELKPRRPTNRTDKLGLLEYKRAKRVFDTGIVELGLT